MNNTETRPVMDMLYDRYGKLYLDKKETAKLLDVGIATLDRMRQSGEIRSSKIKGAVKFALTEIAKFIPN